MSQTEIELPLPPVPWAHRVRGAWRAGALLLVLLRGQWLVRVQFPRLSPAGRDQALVRWSSALLRAAGVRVQGQGQPLTQGLLVGNHLSWIDTMAINAYCPARFVAKAEVRRWPLVGDLCARSGTLFIEREKRGAARQVVSDLVQRLQQGHLMCFFPEGTTGDGVHLRRFHGNLFESAIQAGCAVQPLALRYGDAHGAPSAAMQYIGKTQFVQSLWRMVCADQVVCYLDFLEPIRPGDDTGLECSRQAWSQQAQQQIQASLSESQPS